MQMMFTNVSNFWIDSKLPEWNLLFHNNRVLLAFTVGISKIFTSISKDFTSISKIFTSIFKMFKETESELQKTISQGSTELQFVTPTFIKISSHKVMSWFATTYRIWMWSTDLNSKRNISNTSESLFHMLAEEERSPWRTISNSYFYEILWEWMLSISALLGAVT